MSDNKLQAFFKLPDGEQFDRGVTTLDDPNKGSAVVWAPMKYSATITRNLKSENIGAYGSCSRGHCGWYVLQTDFNSARTSLLKDYRLQNKKVVIVTPDLTGL